jgi:putative spermidine/putrescine transport system permease protein
MSAVRILLRLVVMLAFTLVLGPILTVVVLSFSASDYLAVPPPGLSLRWFERFFTTASLRGALGLSFTLALTAAATATVFGLLAAYATVRRRGARSDALQALFMAPLVFPTIILGLALLLYFRSLGVPILIGLFLAHVVVCLPYCFRACLTSLTAFDRTLEEAGQSLGASPLRTFFRVTLPIVWPGVVSGFLFAFVVSIGELNTSLFLTGPGVTTLPIEIYSYLQFEGSQLVVAAASTVQVAIIVIAILVMERLVGIARVVQR